MVSFLKQLFENRLHKPMDQLQLEAAQDRLYQRSDDLEIKADELTKMIRRMNRKKPPARKK